MEGALAGVIQTVFHQKADENEASDLLCEIETVQQELDSVDSRFDFQDDPDLVDACIYEMQALSARYRYLLREIRRLGITVDVLAGYQGEQKRRSVRSL